MADRRERYRITLATAVIFTLAAGEFWRHAISWYGWAALSLALLAAVVVEIVRERPRLRPLPRPLVVFLALATVSLAWSVYPGGSIVGLAGTWATVAAGVFLAVALRPADLVRASASALRWILVLSLVFEFVVDVFVQRPLIPFFPMFDPSEDPIPRAFYWSRALLFEGGRIQGIVGNANLLGFLALLALIVFGVQAASGRLGRRSALIWLGVAALVMALTRSSTAIVAAVGVVVVLVAALVIRRLSGRVRTWTGVGLLVAGVAGAAGVVALREPLLGLLGKSSDLTYRFDIWDTVVAMAAERPVVGWGWVSYWAPWVHPFEDLVVIRGVTYLQAHNAWLDVWMQLGVVGLVVFAALVLGTLARSWWHATERPRTGATTTGPFPAFALLPLLVMTALVVQSLAESRILVELGLALLVVCALVTSPRSPRPQPAVAAANGRRAA